MTGREQLLVRTEDERAALPRGAVVRSDAGTIACRFDRSFGVVFGDDRPIIWTDLALPLTVLWQPMDGAT